MADQQVQKQEMVKVRILSYVGPYSPNQVVELPKDQADQLIMGGTRARLDSDHQTLQGAKLDPKDMTVSQRNALGLKTVVDSMPASGHIIAAMDKAALDGHPVATGEPLHVTGPITPGTSVFPELAEQEGRTVSQAEDIISSELKKQVEEEKKGMSGKPASKPQPKSDAKKEDQVEDKKK